MWWGGSDGWDHISALRSRTSGGHIDSRFAVMKLWSNINKGLMGGDTSAGFTLALFALLELLADMNIIIIIIIIIFIIIIIIQAHHVRVSVPSF